MDKYYAITSGNITFSDNNLLITFKYDPERFEFIKTVSGVKYLKEKKVWQVPLSNLDKIVRSDYFSPQQIEYRFDLNEVFNIFNQNFQDRKSAIEQIRQNPFSVNSKLLDLVDLDLIVRKTEKNNLILISGSQKLLQDLLKNSRSAIFSKRDKGFIISVSELNDILKLAKLFKYTFAVEEELSKMLTDSVEIRKNLPFSNHNSNALAQACLSPVFDFTQNLCLKNNSSEILAKCLPLYNTYSERIAVARSADFTQFVSAVENSIFAGFAFAFTKEIFSLLSQANAALLNLFSGEIDYCFISSNSENGIILNKNKTFVLTRLEDAGIIYSKIKSQFFDYEVVTFNIRDFYQVFDQLGDLLADHEGYNYSVNFKSYQKTIERRNRNENYRVMTDYELILNNQGLVNKLFPHQRVGVAWLMQNPVALLGDDMGLGKTLTVLTTFQERLFRNEVNFLIVVCPASLMRNWRKESEEWTPDLKLEIISDDKIKKIKHLENIFTSDVNGLIINYESARLDYVMDNLVEICKQKNVMLCFDESQRLKNANGKTFKALQRLSFLSENRLLLSGTPSPKAITDIWSQMYILDHGQRLGRNYYDWLRHVAELGNRYSEFAIRSYKPEIVNETLDYVQELLLRRKKEDVLDLPDKIFSTRDLELAGDQKKLYEVVRENLLVLMSNSNPKEIYNMLEQYLRAVQIAVNPRLVDPDWKGEPVKFVELDQIVNELVVEQDKKIVVWTNYLKNIDELLVRYKDLGVCEFSGRISGDQRQKIVNSFQSSDSKLRILLAIPAAGGVGITLHAAQTAIYLDKTWNAEHWLQSVDRIHRIGQKGVVNIISLNATPVDWLIYKSLLKKTKEQAKLLGDIDTLPSFSELLQAVS